MVGKSVEFDAVLMVGVHAAVSGEEVAVHVELESTCLSG